MAGNGIATERYAYYEAERSALRQELHNLKGCQITFLTTTITATGLLLGLSATFLKHGADDAARLQGLALFLPLAVIIPFWWIFFDKAKTITRVVGYYRVLEGLMLGRYEAKRYHGWENALEKMRRFREKKQGAKAYKVEPEYQIPWSRIIFLTTSNRYWPICYYIFLILSLISFFLGVTTVQDLDCGRAVLEIALAVIIMISAAVNLQAVWNLINGANSYRANEKAWKKILKVRRRRTRVPDEANGMAPESYMRGKIQSLKARQPRPNRPLGKDFHHE
ncbi:MAG TPA: hypothetical protein ENJ19_04120 [Gammaproteobacteria bacterium]|nr:hypothetical protein [Gammaproteobacteria bacterium]